MPRNWRCANGHAWTGDLGALTYCPDCGSADVYEVRPQYESAVSAPADVEAANSTDHTYVQPAAVKSGSAVERPAAASVGDTFVQAPAPKANIGDTYVQAAASKANVGDTFVQGPVPKTNVGDTFVQPALGDGDTFIQPASPGTTQQQLYVPVDDGGTLVQASALGTDPIADGGTLIQAPGKTKDDSTLEIPALDTNATINQTAAPAVAADGPTLLAPKATPSSSETRLYQAPADGGSVPADTPTLDAPGGDGTSYRTTDYPSTVNVERGPGARPQGISGMDTRPAAPTPPRSRDGRPVTPPPVSGYEILGVLGRGGMGVVYKARQVKLNRIVALKMILAGGHAGAYERQRFVTEANAVAALQHPNIVQIYETGERDGLPYFSLEFCDGGSLQQKLGGQPMPPKIAADVAEQLARAMQYAHERGIVHRDLKPANILFAGDEAAAAREKAAPSKDSKVTAKDAKTVAKESKVSRDAIKDASQSKTSQSKAGQSVTSSRGGSSTASMRASRVTPKITDFGLAKRLEDDSGLTGSGTILGTPSYMAPEQAEGKTKSVGPPADIHALGAILYEMLTGRPPFLGDNVVETMNQVRTMDPVPPTRIQPKTPKDLETVCLKCLQKEMYKRYGTAGDLADDLRRFLDGEPIAARPVPVWEKGWKWAKRRPAQAALIALSVAVLIGTAVGGVAFGQFKDRQAEVEKGLKNEAEKSEKKAIQQKQIAEEAFRRAEANFKSAREAVESLLVRIGAERLQYVPQAEKLRRELLEKSLGFYDRFLIVHGNDPAVKREAGWAYQRVGRIRDDLGDRNGAITAFQKAAEFFDNLAKDTNNIDDMLEFVITQRQLTVKLEENGQPDKANAAYEAARLVLRQLADANPDRPAFRYELAELLMNRSMQFVRRHQLSEAETTFRQALAEFDRVSKETSTLNSFMSRAKAQANFGDVLLTENQTKKAISELRGAAVKLIDLVGHFPDNAECAKQLGQTTSALGNALYKAAQFDQAEAAYQLSIERLTKVADQFPSIPEYRQVLAQAHDNLALFLKNTKSVRAAEPERKLARDLYLKLLKEMPNNAEYQFRYAIDLDEYANFLAQTDRLNEALREEKSSLGLLRALVAADPLNPEYASTHARGELNLGQLFARNGQADEAVAEYASAAALFEGLADRKLMDDESWNNLADVYIQQGLIFQTLGRDRGVDRCVRQAVAVRERIVTAHPDRADAVARLAHALAILASLPTVKPQEGITLMKEALRRQRAAMALAPKPADFVENAGQFGNKLVSLLTDQGDHAAAAAAASDLTRDVPVSWPGWPIVAGQLARCVRLARTDKALSDEQKAKISTAYGAQALDLLGKAVAAGFKNSAALRDSTEMEVLRTDPAFKPKFDEILALIDAKNKK